jgi:hypothetical protein
MRDREPDGSRFTSALVGRIARGHTGAPSDSTDLEESVPARFLDEVVAAASAIDPAIPLTWLGVPTRSVGATRGPLACHRAAGRAAHTLWASAGRTDGRGRPAAPGDRQSRT